MLFNLPAQEAKNDSTIGPALAQYNIKGIDLCKRYNEYCTTNSLKEGIVFKVWVSVKKDRTFTFYLNTPTIFFLFEKVSENLNINLRDVYKIALIKSKDLINYPLDLIYKSLLHSLKFSKYNVIC